jgi:PAS domain S-box-containing protein
VLDLVTLVIAALLVGWTVIAGGVLSDANRPVVERSLVVIHVLGSVAVVVVTASLLASSRRANASVALLAAGSLGLLAADTAEAMADLQGVPAAAAWELGYLVCYAAWGLAALPASMAQLTAPPQVAPRPGRGLGLLPLLLIALTGPALTIMCVEHGNTADVIVVAVGSSIMTVLVTTRLRDAVRLQAGAVARERLLRHACAELVAAVDAGAIAGALRTGIERLMPKGHPHRTVFVTAEDVPAGGAWQPHMTLPHQLHGVQGGRRSRITETRLLHPALGTLVGGRPATLVASLVADEPARHLPPARAVAVGADARVLAALQDTLEVLASQAALALHRVADTEEARRQDRHSYLTAVGESTTDVVILLDDDEWIRYASPSMAALLRVTVPVFATWRDIVHHDDHEQVRETLDRARASRDSTAVNTEWTLRRSDGSWIQVEVNCRDLRHNPAVQGLVVTIRDVTPDRRVDLPARLRRLDRSAPGRNRRSVSRRFN